MKTLDLTQPLNWNQVFSNAAAWPEYRVYNWKMYKKILGKDYIAFLKYLRTVAESARTIILSDSLLWAIAKLLMELEPEFLFEQVLQARMPFPATLFTWSGQARLAVNHELGMAVEIKDEYPISEVPACLVLGSHIYDMVYDTRKPLLSFFPLSVCLGQTPNVTLKQVVAEHKAPPSTVVEWMFTTKMVREHPDCVKLADDPRISISLSGPLSVGTGAGTPNELKYLMAGTGGNFRWFGALCTLLNCPAITRYVDTVPGTIPLTTKTHATAAPGQTMVFMLPKEKVVSRLLRAIEHERKKVGLHQVRGDWCYSRRKGDPNCKHVWPLQPTRRLVCEVCGMVKWFRKAHERGEGETLKVKQRRADFTGQSVDRLVEAIKEGH